MLSDFFLLIGIITSGEAEQSRPTDMMPFFEELEVISTDVPASTDSKIMPITPSTLSVLVTAADISPFPKMSTTYIPSRRQRAANRAPTVLTESIQESVGTLSGEQTGCA